MLSPNPIDSMGNYLVRIFPFINAYFPQTKSIDSILIHIHGGGFIAGSSRGQQTFTRQWANITGLAVFSIDYHLSPDYSYPAAIEDVWQGYYWIIKYSKEILKADINKVILIGDSAGGCLATAVVIKAIQASFRKPDYLILGYPCLNLDPRHFYPSILMGFDNVLIKALYMQICNKFYVGGKDTQNDPFLSPITVKDGDLIQFPEVIFMAAGKDSLRDHSYAMHNRLLYKYNVGN